jgi:hypothetical protein
MSLFQVIRFGSKMRQTSFFRVRNPLNLPQSFYLSEIRWKQSPEPAPLSSPSRQAVCGEKRASPYHSSQLILRATLLATRASPVASANPLPRHADASRAASAGTAW